MTDREKLIDLLGGDMCKGCCCYDCEYETDEKGCIEEIKRKMADHLLANGVTIPVRCKDCKYFELNPFDGCEVCTHISGYVRPDFGCVDGERKDNG